MQRLVPIDAAFYTKAVSVDKVEFVSELDLFSLLSKRVWTDGFVGPLWVLLSLNSFSDSVVLIVSPVLRV